MKRFYEIGVVVDGDKRCLWRVCDGESGDEYFISESEFIELVQNDSVFAFVWKDNQLAIEYTPEELAVFKEMHVKDLSSVDSLEGYLANTEVFERRTVDYYLERPDSKLCAAMSLPKQFLIGSTLMFMYHGKLSDTEKSVLSRIGIVCREIAVPGYPDRVTTNMLIPKIILSRLDVNLLKDFNFVVDFHCLVHKPEIMTAKFARNSQGFLAKLLVSGEASEDDLAWQLDFCKKLNKLSIDKCGEGVSDVRTSTAF